MHRSLSGRPELSFKNIMGISSQYMVNVPFEVLAHLNPTLLPIPPSVVIFVQAASSYANCLAITATCHNFHRFTHFFLSPKHPNTRSNHDMILSYLIFSFHTLRSHEEELGKQIVLEYR